MKPAKKFKLGAVYIRNELGSWISYLCTRDGDKNNALICRTGVIAAVYLPAEIPHLFYRIRARDWEPFSGLFFWQYPGHPDYAAAVRDVAALVRNCTPTSEFDDPFELATKEANFFNLNRTEPSPRLSITKPLWRPEYQTGPQCTCGIGQTIEARRHYEVCEMKRGVG